MESDPYVLIEGMIIAGIVTGATKGYIYVRSEYPHAIATLNRAIDKARDAGWLGDKRARLATQRFELEVAKGAGSYVCGEETALLESLEGKRGIVRAKPPVPALVGLFGQPTVINNVITLATVPIIFAQAARRFITDFGMGRSRGTLPFQLAGNVKQGGLVELAFGVTLARTDLFDYGGGTASGRPARAVQVGGPLGTYLPESQWDIPMDYEAYAAVGAVVGHGGIVDSRRHVESRRTRAIRDALLRARIVRQMHAVPDRLDARRRSDRTDPRWRHLAEDKCTLLRDLCDTMVSGSLCAMGGMTPFRCCPRSTISLKTSVSISAQSGCGLNSELNMSTCSTPPQCPAGSPLDGGCGSGNCACKSQAQAQHRAPRSLSTIPTTARRASCRRRRHARNRRPVGDGAGRHFGDARRDRSRRQRAETLRDGFARAVRVMPSVPGRDRRQARLPGFVHDARRSRYESAHANRTSLQSLRK